MSLEKKLHFNELREKENNLQDKKKKPLEPNVLSPHEYTINKIHPFLPFVTNPHSRLGNILVCSLFHAVSLYVAGFPPSFYYNFQRMKIYHANLVGGRQSTVAQLMFPASHEDEGMKGRMRETT